MTTSDVRGQAAEPPPGRFWIVKRVMPFLRVAILGFLPCPDLITRYRMRRAARGLVTLRTWPGTDASSAEAAQLAMMRLLWLQRQTRRAVRARQREAAVMLARASVETLFLGLYCRRVPEAVAQLHASNIKALSDGFGYFEDAGIVPTRVIRACAARLGEPSRKHLGVWDMVQAMTRSMETRQHAAFTAGCTFRSLTSLCTLAAELFSATCTARAGSAGGPPVPGRGGHRPGWPMPRSGSWPPISRRLL